MSFQRLVVNSQSRNNQLSNSSSDFVILLNNNFFMGDCKRMKLEYLLMPTAYNITSANQNFQVRVGPTTYNVTIAQGVYDANTLAAAVKAALELAVSNTWSVSYSTTTRRFTITGTSAFELLYASGSSASSTNNIWQMLGFANSNGTQPIDTSSSTSVTSTQLVQLNGPLNLYVHVLEFSQGFITTDNIYSTFVIPNTSQMGSYIEYSGNENYEQFCLVPNQFSRLTIRVLDRNNNVVDLGNLDWTMILRACP